MATIKTQLVGNEQRIITKSGLISCSCCEAGCCMYPASQLGVGYAQADLPDAVTINWAGYSSGSASRSGSTYTVGGTTLAVSGGIWVLTNGSATQNVGACLIPDDGGYTAGDDLVEDQFAATYTSSWTPFGGSEVTLTMQRNALCTWIGSGTIGGQFYQAGLSYLDTQYQWVAFWIRGAPPIQISNNLYKDAPHNTPIGTYEYVLIEGEFEPTSGNPIYITA